MSTQKDKFEKMFEEALRDHEMPYDGQAWNAMNQKIVKQGLRKSGYSAGLVAAATIGVAITVAASVFLLQDDKNQNIVSIDVPNSSASESTAQVNGGMNHNNFDHDNNSVTTDKVVDEKNDNRTVSSEQEGSNEQQDNNNRIHKLDKDDSALLTNSSGQATEEDPELDGIDGSHKKVDDATVHHINEDHTDIPVHVDMQASAYEVCKGNAVKFVAEGSSEFDYFWIVEGQKIEGKEATISFSNAGNTTVSLEVLKGDEVVYNESTTIQVHQPVDAEVVVTPPTNKTYPEYTFSIDKENQVKSIVWEVEDVQSNNETVEHLFRKKGDYIVTAEIKDFNGCRNKVHTDLNIRDDYNLYAASGLEINATDYKRKTFMPAALEVMNVPFEMMIYDRSNKLLYETSNVNQPWTGIDINTNQIVSTGAYVWVVKLKNKEGKEEVYFGTVTVIK